MDSMLYTEILKPHGLKKPKNFKNNINIVLMLSSRVIHYADLDLYLIILLNDDDNDAKLKRKDKFEPIFLVLMAFSIKSIS